MKNPRQLLGKWGESLAADYLIAKGYSILERNARTSYGEIDLVVCQESDLSNQEGKRLRQNEAGRSSSASITVFVEVKTRSTPAYGMPEESVTPLKRSHLLSAAEAYMQAHPDLEQVWRIDVIAIQKEAGIKTPVITHFENAIEFNSNNQV